MAQRAWRGEHGAEGREQRAASFAEASARQGERRAEGIAQPPSLKLRRAEKGPSTSLRTGIGKGVEGHDRLTDSHPQITPAK